MLKKRGRRAKGAPPDASRASTRSPAASSRGAPHTGTVPPKLAHQTVERQRAANAASKALRDADRQEQRAAGFKPSADTDPFYDETLTPDQRTHYYDRADRDPVSSMPF